MYSAGHSPRAIISWPCMIASRLNAQCAAWSSSVIPIINWSRCRFADAMKTERGMPFSQFRSPYLAAPRAITLAFLMVAKGDNRSGLGLL